MRVVSLVVVAALWSPLAGHAQSETVEVPLRVVDGRLLIAAEGPHGGTHEFILGLGMNAVSQSGAQQVGAALSALDLGGIRIDLGDAQVLPDEKLALADGSTPVGVIGGQALHLFDVLIDLPQGRLLIKRSARSVRWDGVSLSSPVATRVFHDALMRVDVEVGGTLVGGLLDFVQPYMGVNAPLGPALGSDATRMSDFRMGYSSWSDLPASVIDDPLFKGWDPDGNGFVVVGAAIAVDCAIAVSWQHAELRTCLR